jgi:hypothetical protein
MIRLTFKRAFLPVLAGAMLATPMAAVEANAKIKDVKFHFPTTSLDNTVHMVMVHNGSGWNWTNKSDAFNARVKVYFKASGKVGSASVRLIDSGAGIWALPAGYKTNKYEKLVTYSVGKAMLSPFQGKAKAVCDVFGGSKKQVHDIGLKTEMYVSQSSKVVRKYANMPVRIVCMPKKASKPSAGLKVAKINFYTIPARPVCNKPVSVVADFVTSTPGKVEFSLVRNDGANQKQSAIMQGQRGKPMAIGKWLKTYNFKKNTNRRYQIVLANQPMKSKWIDVKVSCGVGTTGGKAKRVKS